MKDNELKSIDQLIRDVLFENERQINKWGLQERTLFEWLAYLTEEVGELSKAISEYEYRGADISDITKESIQVATLALKVAEMSGYAEVRG
jgi:NTP pyrophosphatase (non-canonical NTP hydrolase)